MLPHVVACLRGPTASGRLLGALTTTYWAQQAQQEAQIGAQQQGQASALPPDLQEQLLPVLLELLAAPAPGAQAPYAELAPLYAQLRAQAQAVVARGVAAGVPLALAQPLGTLGAEGALALAVQVPAGAPRELELGAQALQSSAALLQSSEAFLHTGVGAALAGGVVRLGALPPKLNSVIQPLVRLAAWGQLRRACWALGVGMAWLGLGGGLLACIWGVGPPVCLFVC
jgi:hypothetical protein